MVKWTTEEQLKLLRTALLCDANFKFDAKAVVAAWPVGGNEDPPTERAAHDRYKQIMQHGRDLSTLSEIKKEETGKKSGVNSHMSKEENGIIAPKPAASTPAQRSQTNVRGSSSKKRNTGSKRKRHSRAESSDTEMASEPETSSDSETAVDSTTPRSTRSLRARKPRTAPAVSEESDIDVEVSTRDYGSGDSDEDYHLAKDR